MCISDIQVQIFILSHLTHLYIIIVLIKTLLNIEVNKENTFIITNIQNDSNFLAIRHS